MSNTRTVTASSNGAAKPRAARPRVAVQDKPAGVGLNLDTLEREGAPVAPFVVVLDGRPRTFLDPFEMDWQELASAINDPRVMFRLALSEEDGDDLLGAKIPVWKINTLVETYLRHYGIDIDARGNLVASQT